MNLARVPFPRRIPKPQKRGSRWRSQAHLNHVRGFACSWNGCDQRPIEAAHVRLGSGSGIGQKPDDHRAVSLCAFHHRQQHAVGEATFWRGRDVEGLIAQFIASSPKRREIEAAMRERGQ